MDTIVKNIDLAIQIKNQLYPFFKKIFEEDGPMSLIQNMHYHADEFYDLSGIYKEGRATCGSCTQSYCCHSEIPVSKMEADYIIFQLRENPDLIPNMERLKLQSEKDYNSLSWMDKACPMLLEPDENGKRLCSIYEARPLICRTYNSGEDPEFCNKPIYLDRKLGQFTLIQAEVLNPIAIDLEGGRGFHFLHKELFKEPFKEQVPLKV